MFFCSRYIKSIVFILVNIAYSTAILADDFDADFLFDLTLEQLMKVKVSTSNLTESPLNLTPASITIISNEQIEKTPARNLLDLIEVYVPGALFVSHFSSGPRLLIRGLGERHYQTLLLVNDRPVNQKGFQGAMVELRSWDMSDIERVEVVRGPGSVSHGPGAIAGVINIITKQAKNEQGLAFGLDYNEAYNSKGIKLSYGGETAGTKYLLHGSVTRTQGVEHYGLFQFLANGESGYKATDDFTGNDGNPLQAYYADFDDEPQIKLYIDIDFAKQWRFWARYNNSGQTDTHTQREIQGKMQDWRAFQSRYYIATLEHNYQFNEHLSVKSILSYDSEDYYDIRSRQEELANTHELNRRYSFSEEESYFKSTLDYQIQHNFSVALAFEFSRDSIAAPWGKSAQSFLAKAGGDAFISQNSIYLGNGKGGTFTEKDVVKFTSGWSANTYSLSTELKYQPFEQLHLIASARTDKNTYTNSMFSPRLAAVYQVNEKNIIKASWQRSLRMNTMMELYWLDINDIKAEPEKTSTYELSHNYMPTAQLHLSLTSFYNDSEIFSWDGNNQTLLGNIKAYGIEPEVAYRTKRFSFGFNHSFFELIDWNFLLKEEGGSVNQKISYSDMNYQTDFLTLSSTGNSVNDWVNQQTKLWFDYQVNEQWQIHVDGRIIWRYEYGQDLFTMYNNAYAQVDTDSLSDNDFADYNQDLATLNTYNQTLSEKGGYDKDIRINASITWYIKQLSGAKIVFYGMNLVNLTDNKRQKVNFSSRTLPVAAWIEEPRSFGVKFSYDF